MYKNIFLLVILLLSSVKHVKPSEININDKTLGSLLGEQIYVLKPSEELSFEEVKNSGDFVLSDQKAPNLGFSKHSIWLKFTLNNETEIENFLLDISYPILDEVELYTIDSIKTERFKLGESKIYKERIHNHPDFIFNLSLKTQTSKTCYLRIKSIEQLILPISINEPNQLWFKLNKENLLSGIYLGCVLIMFLYNLFIYFSVKDRSYLYYVIYVAGVGLTQIGIKGYNYQYLWPESPHFELKSLTYFACMSGIAALLFTKQFLHTKVNAKRYDYILTAIIFALLLALFLTIFNFDQLGFQLMQISTTMFAIAILTVSFKIMRRPYLPARYVFFSWSVLLIGAIIFTLKDNGLLPFNTFTSYSMQLASAIEMALLSFGLASRINILKKEKEESQAEALKISIENERIIKEQNVILEQKVNERTRELKQANNELSITLEDLKQTQSQLVAAEKMASLGQLTAGIAHEINNPINFVTSNVSPLQRDVKMLIQTIETYEELIFSEQDTEEKRQQIEEHKEDLDYDYLKIEIDHLLKGINEGASRTAEIVKGLRVFSRVDEDDLKIANILEGLDSTLVIMNNLINASNISVTKHYEENIPQVECYPGKLNQVFLNIISNSIYAINQTHKNNGNGNIDISVKTEKDTIIIDMKDNGCGIAEHNLTKIFDPFFTTKDVGEGTGLGMSIAYNTVKKHNGNIELFSEVNKGTLIRITLPIKQNAVSSQTT